MERINLENESKLMKSLKANYIEKDIKPLTTEEKRAKLKKMKHMIISAAIQFKRLNVSLEDFYDHKVTVKYPLELPCSKEFLLSAREGDIDEIKKYLYKDKRYAFCFDLVKYNLICMIVRPNCIALCS